MKQGPGWLLAIVMSAMLCGCATTSRTWEQPEAETLQHKLKAGDRVTVVSSSGKTYRFEVTSFSADTLYGQGGKTRYKIAYSMIDSIQVERSRAWPGIVGVTAVVVVGALAVAVDNLNDQNWDLCGGN